MEKILPTIDRKKLQEKANEAAQKGAESEIDDFYNGYNSPFKKAIKEQLENNGVSVHLGLPDIIGLMNEQITAKADQIANEAISKTYIPEFVELLTRSKPEEMFSELLKEFIEKTGFEYDSDLSPSDYRVEIEDSYPDSNVLLNTFFDIRITNGQTTYLLHINNTAKKGELKKFKITGLPRLEGSNVHHERTMKLSFDGGHTLEMPFQVGILHDPFIAYLAGFVIANTVFTLDVDDFDEDYFPSDHCHC